MPSLDLNQLKITRTAKLPGELLCVARAIDSSRLWIGSSDSNVYGIDLSDEKPQPVTLKGHQSYVTGAVLAGQQLVTGSWDRQLIWWDLEKQQPRQTVAAHERWIRQLALAPDGQALASIADDMVVRLWDAESARPIRELKGHAARLPRYDYRNKLFACAFSWDGKYVAASDETAEVIVWETLTGKEATRFQATAFYHSDDWVRNNHPYGGLRSLAFSPDGRLAMGGLENTDVAVVQGHGLVQVRDWQAGKQTYEYKSKDSKAQYEVLRFHPRGEWLLAGVGAYAGKPGLSFLNLEKNCLAKEHASDSVFGLALDEEGAAIYTVGRDGVVNQWAIPS